MVESIGICEKHLLPLDESGECELCRLSDMPSSAPRARSAWWALIIPVAILGLLAMAAYFAILSDDESPATQGVPPIAPVAAPETPAPAEPTASSAPRWSTSGFVPRSAVCGRWSILCLATS